MRVAVTGATGFLGSHVIDTLLAAGHEPVCLVRRTSRLDHLKPLGVDTVEGGLDDAGSLLRLTADVDAVIHNAGLVKALRAEQLHDVNVRGTARLAAAAASNAERIRCFVHVSSVVVKGPSPAADRPIPAGAPPAPVSDYGRSKAAAEAAVLSLQQDVAVRIVRPAVIYGPRDDNILPLYRAVQRGLFPIPSPPGSTLSTVYGPDCARAVLAALTANGKAPRVVEVADGPPHAWEEFRDAVAAALGVSRVRTLRPPAWITHTSGRLSSWAGHLRGRAPPFNRDKAREAVLPHWIADHRSADELGWRPETPLLEGVARTVAWYRETGRLR